MSSDPKASSPLAAIVLAAGHGTRMRSAKPKVLHPIGHLPMLGHSLKAARTLGAEKVAVVVGAGGDQVRAALEGLDPAAEVAVQDPPLGTGDAVRAALPLLDGFEGQVLVLYGDTPLIKAETLGQLLGEIARGAGIAVLGFEAEEPGPYGRLVTDGAGRLTKIVEAKDASPDELAIRLCNSGVMAMTTEVLRRYIPQLTNDNAKGEYYLTDLVGLARQDDNLCAVVQGEESEMLGVNNRAELAVAEAVFQDRRRTQMMLSGVTLLDPHTVYFAHDTEIGEDSVIGQNVVFGPGVRLARSVTVKPFSHLEGAVMHASSSAGPFARLRQGTELASGAAIGNFVETKKAVLGEGVKAGHLTYLGDVTIGAKTNIGAGTITCNYDGFAKHQTQIGKGAFIGSSTMLVAPVSIGEGAITGSGSVITKNVEPDALAVARGRQMEKSGWAAAFRKKNGRH
ncbi:MAG: bifunctional UDP-N-acetylglucosamine diphosphorylase/glucosamine-1-phosphate N-acetyltransferase GlmU [Pseudomonadota bacterium]